MVSICQLGSCFDASYGFFPILSIYKANDVLSKIRVIHDKVQGQNEVMF